MTLIRDYIMSLHLDPESPYPWQVLRDEEKAAEVRAEILRVRKATYGKHLELVRPDSNLCDSDAFDFSPDPDRTGDVR